MIDINDFYTYLSRKGLGSILDRTSYRYTPYSRDEELFYALKDIVDNNKKTLIYGDYDVDGLMSLLIVRDTLATLKVTNIDTYEYKNRTHKLDFFAVEQAIQDNYEYMIICDTGSSPDDIEQLKRLSFFGVKTIVLDHHRTFACYDDFPKDCVIVNTTIENRLLNEEKFVMSAGALVFTVMNELLERYGIYENNLSAYALCSLYADCIDMSNKINRGIYYKATSLSELALPKYFQNFLNDYQIFCRRFIEFRFSPKINALIRAERFDVLSEYINSSNTVETMKLLSLIDDIHSSSRKLIDTVSDIITYEEKDSLCLAVMSESVNRYISIDENKLYNYTGLVANKISGRRKKPCVVLCRAGNSIKGSFRDLYSRDYLSLFRTFCNAEGHSAAFGIKLEFAEFIDFENTLNLVDQKFKIEDVGNKPIIIDGSGHFNTREMRDLCIYNEFSGNKIPTVLVKKKMTGLREFKSPYNFKYRWGDYYIISDTRLLNGDTVYCKPTLRKSMSFIV